MLSGVRDLAKKLIAKHNSFGKFCQLCCCCCFTEDPLLGTDAPDTTAKPEDLEGGGGDTSVQPPATPALKTPSPQAAVPSARGSPSAGGGGGGSAGNDIVVDDGQQPGPSTADPSVEHTQHGTPLTSRLPPPSSRHTPKEETPKADDTGESGDVGFIEADEEPLCIAGKVLISFTYIPGANKLNLKVVRLADLPPVQRGGAEMVKIHLCVLPMRNQRFQTKQQSATQGVFNQTFQFVHMTKDLLETCAIRLRVYGKEGFINKRLIGEAKIALSKVDLTSPLADGDMWKNLSPKGEVVCLFLITFLLLFFSLLFLCLSFWKVGFYPKTLYSRH